MDDFDDDLDLDLDDTGFDDFEDKEGASKTSLKDLWEKNPMFKVGAILVGVAAIVGVVSMLGGEKLDVASSRVTTPPEMRAKTSTEGSSQAYIDAVMDQNEQRLEDAVSSGGSAIPTPIDVETGVFSIVGETMSNKFDPIERWKKMRRQKQQSSDDCNCSGVRSESMSASVQRKGVVPIGYDANGNPIYGYDKDGNAIIGYDENGRPIIGYDENGNPIYADIKDPIAYDKDGHPIYGYDENGRPIMGYDENGNPIYGAKVGFDENGKSLVGFDENGKPLAGFGPDGRPLPGYGLDGKPLPGFDENGKLMEDAVPEDNKLIDFSELVPAKNSGVSPLAGLTAEQITARQKLVDEMAAKMAEQMGSILQNKTATAISSVVLTSPSVLEDMKEEAEAEAAAANDESSGGVEEIILPAGEIVFAQTLIEANSDIDGPVLAQIVSGPLNGSKILGSFTVVEDEYLTLNFETLVLDGKSMNVEGIAVDPDTNLVGMATEVDNHYLERVFLPMAASFIEGMATAISETGMTTVTIKGETVTSEESEADNEQEVAAGVAEAGTTLKEILDDMVPETPTVIIAPGTPIGILFTAPVTQTIK